MTFIQNVPGWQDVAGRNSCTQDHKSEYGGNCSGSHPTDRVLIQVLPLRLERSSLKRLCNVDRAGRVIAETRRQGKRQ
jgi:hypothetical protein